jgi:hypothetical protein
MDCPDRGRVEVVTSVSMARFFLRLFAQQSALAWYSQWLWKEYQIKSGLFRLGSKVRSDGSSKPLWKNKSVALRSNIERIYLSLSIRNITCAPQIICTGGMDPAGPQESHLHLNFYRSSSVRKRP